MAATRPVRSITPTWRLVAATAVVAVAVLLGIALVLNRRRPQALVFGKATQVTSHIGLEVQPTLSPDGRHLAYAAGSSALTRIVVRPVGDGRTIPLTNEAAESEWLPHWSPDGARCP